MAASRVRRALALALVPGLVATNWSALPGANVATAADTGSCAPGERTLSLPGEVLFPEAGNGGYRSLHTDVSLVYDARKNRLLTGTHVVLQMRAEQCLSEFSLDFEPADPHHRQGSPRLVIEHLDVAGVPASHRFARPSYPGNPRGPDDPDPRAHQQSQTNPVGGPHANPLPPACSPTLSGHEGRHARDGRPCPRTKLVITPTRPIGAGERFTVRIDYSGRPGLHHGADGERDGWWSHRGGGVTNTEPLGTQAWMPLNNHPSAKPTYDVRVRTQRGKTVVANGEPGETVLHPPDALFRRGSATTQWHSADPVASYLVLVLVGDYTVERLRRGEVSYRLLQDRHLPRPRRGLNARRLHKLDDSTALLRHLSGPFPFSTDGAAVTLPAHTDMEMQTMSIFGEGTIDTSTLYHENMHQWWGDAVGQASFDMVWFKEGLATFAEDVRRAWLRSGAHGWPSTGRRRARFEAALRAIFDRVYVSGVRFWKVAPSAPSPWDYFGDAPVYRRPGAMYLALYLDLGHRRFSAVLQDLQRRYRGGSITRADWERAWLAQMPTARCRTLLSRFFEQWLDTSYPVPGRDRADPGSSRPALTGPGLAGGGFPRACLGPDGE